MTNHRNQPSAIQALIYGGLIGAALFGALALANANQVEQDQIAQCQQTTYQSAQTCARQIRSQQAHWLRDRIMGTK